MTSTIIPFTKMHGLGNDFVMVNREYTKTVNNLQHLAKSIAQRRLGIGCDQAIFFTNIAKDHYLMEIYNTDGSPAKACGNATRCLALLVSSQTKASSLCIEVFDRKLQCTIDESESISVNMGQAEFCANWIPAQDKLWELSSIYKLNPRELICVDVGNPHLIIFHEALSESEMEFLGKKFASHSIFSDGVNVNFVHVVNSDLHITVWERGVGLSLACGSGACASFAAAYKLGFIQNSKALVHLKLGNLQMKLDKNDIIMTGPATKVATGNYIYQI
jgi:diaminopimelate epimerase